MSRSYKDFKDFDNSGKDMRRKDLRHNAREAQSHFTGVNNDYKEPMDKYRVFQYRHPGRGASGESSN